jgi:hypothetical protein
MRPLVVAVLFLACTRTSTKISNDPVDAGPPKAEVVTPSPKVEAASCSTDGDCAYDDPCNAKACVAKGDAAFVGCDKSLPPPGRCICGQNRCTLMRDAPSTGAAKTGCASDADCAFIAPTGSCARGTPERWIEERGGFCTCSAGICTPELVDAIPCKTTMDCNWLEDPRRPVSAKKVPRTRGPIKPCVDGSLDSVCDAGHCKLRLWKC